METWVVQWPSKVEEPHMNKTFERVYLKTRSIFRSRNSTTEDIREALRFPSFDAAKAASWGFSRPVCLDSTIIEV